MKTKFSPQGCYYLDTDIGIRIKINTLIRLKFILIMTFFPMDDKINIFYIVKMSIVKICPPCIIFGILSATDFRISSSDCTEYAESNRFLK